MVLLVDFQRDILGLPANPDRCAAAGLHTGAELAAELSRLLTARLDRMEKSDLEITAALCRMEHYITLGRHRMTEEDIRRRWQQGGNP